jgi:hypothetical protein
VGSILIKPQNLPERLIWYYIVWMYAAYYLGLQFLITPLLGWFLAFYLIKKWWNQTDETPESEKIVISSSAWIWIIAMITIEATIIINHINFDLGLAQIIRTSIGWSRQWALLALFPLAGHLNIRPQIIYRAVCILAAQSLVVVVIDNLAAIIHLPILSFVSPLKVLGGGPALWTARFFSNVIIQRNDFRLFAGWPTILGMTSVIYFYFACQETDPKWRKIGIYTYVFLIFASQTRTAILSLLFIFIFLQLLKNWFRVQALFMAGFATSILGIFLPKIIDVLQPAKNFLDQYRGKDSAESGKLRGYINRMTIARWQSESPIWGHGVIEEFGQGPRITYGVPLGTHSTWFAILYLHGIVGFLALAIAFIWGFFDLLIKSKSSNTAEVGLAILIVFIIFGFTEPLHIWPYVYWPALLVLGISFKHNRPSSIAIN